MKTLLVIYGTIITLSTSVIAFVQIDAYCTKREQDIRRSHFVNSIIRTDRGEEKTQKK